MKKIVAACLIALIASMISIAWALADSVEGTVRDQNGKVLYGDVIDEADIPALAGIVVKGGYESSQAADILVKFGPKAVPALLDALKGGKATVSILNILARINDGRIVAAAGGYLNSPSDDVRNAAVNALARSASLDVPGMLELLGKSETQQAALDVLMYAKLDEKGLELVRKGLASSNPVERAGAVYLLGWWKDEASKSDIIRLMGDEDPAVRVKAMEGYKALYAGSPDKYDIDILAKGLKDASPAVRASAASALAEMDDDRAVQLLLGLLGTETDHDVLSAAVTALADKHVDAASFPLLKLFNPDDKDSAFEATVAYALGELKAKEAVPYLLEPFKKGATIPLDLRGEMINSLVKIGEPVDLSPFLKYLEPGETETNTTSQTLDLINAYAKPGDKEVVKALEAFKANGADGSQIQYIDEILKRIG